MHRRVAAAAAFVVVVEYHYSWAELPGRCDSRTFEQEHEDFSDDDLLLPLVVARENAG